MRVAMYRRAGAAGPRVPLNSRRRWACRTCKKPSKLGRQVPNPPQDTILHHNCGCIGFGGPRSHEESVEDARPVSELPRKLGRRPVDQVSAPETTPGPGGTPSWLGSEPRSLACGRLIAPNPAVRALRNSTQDDELPLRSSLPWPAFSAGYLGTREEKDIAKS